MNLYSRPAPSTAMTGANDPVYNERGERMVIRECWRTPARPFAAPQCCGRRARHIGWNLYRCTRCAARIQPERLWHRLLLGRNPFRDAGRARDLWRVTRWARAAAPHPPGSDRGGA